MEVNRNNIFIEICAKHKRNKEFSEVAKDLIIREIETGRSFRAVAKDAKTSPSTVDQIVHAGILNELWPKNNAPGVQRNSRYVRFE
jgi:hypothetical protein